MNEYDSNRWTGRDGDDGFSLGSLLAGVVVVGTLFRYGYHLVALLMFSRVFAALIALLFAGGPLWITLTEPTRLLNWVLTLMCWTVAAIIAYYDVYKGGTR